MRKFQVLVFLACVLGYAPMCAPIRAQEVFIDGPGTLEVKEADLYEINGGTSKAYEWHVFPSVHAKLRRVFMDRGFDEDGAPVFGPGVLFKSTKSGTYELVFVDFSFKRVLKYTIQVGSGPDPDPNPDPDPKPDPDPEPVAVFGVIIEERSDRAKLTPQRAMIFESSVVRDLFRSDAFHVRDDDVRDETGSTPRDMKPYIDRARKLGLPAMFLVNGEGKVLFEGSVPKDVPETVKLIQKYLEN